MTGDERLEAAVAWFKAKAWRANDVRNVGAVVARLLEIADERGVDFKRVVMDLSDWALTDPAKAAKKKNIARFYVNCFKRAVPDADDRMKRMPPDPSRFRTLTIDGDPAGPERLGDILGKD